MLSVAPVSFVESCTSHDVLFSDVEFASWDLHDLIFEPEFEYESKPINSLTTSIQSNQNIFNSIETTYGSPDSIESKLGSPHSVKLENEPTDSVDRKLKRTRSNRESARRSRMRKLQHVDNLRNQANRLSTTNKELSNRLRFVMHNGQIVRFENQMLQTEHTMLRHRLIELQNLMIFQGLHQMHNHENNNIASNLFGTAMDRTRSMNRCI